MCLVKIGSVVRSDITGNIGIVYEIIWSNLSNPFYTCIGFNNESFISSEVKYVSESLSDYINEFVRYTA